MSLTDIRARTAERKAAGLIPVYGHTQPTVTATRTERVSLPVFATCARGGTDADIVERCPSCHGGAKHVRECEVHERCTHEPVNPAVMDCRRCRAEGLGYAPAVYPLT